MLIVMVRRDSIAFFNSSTGNMFCFKILTKAKYDLILRQQQQEDGHRQDSDGWRFEKVPALKFDPAPETKASPLCKEIEAKAFNQVRPCFRQPLRYLKLFCPLSPFCFYTKKLKQVLGFSFFFISCF
jgi:hypothetical protein